MLQMEMIGVKGIEFRAECYTKPVASGVPNIIQKRRFWSVIRPRFEQGNARAVHERYPGDVHSIRCGMCAHSGRLARQGTDSSTIVTVEVVDPRGINAKMGFRCGPYAMLDPDREPERRLTPRIKWRQLDPTDLTK